MRLVKEVPLIVLGDFNQIRAASEHFSIASYLLPVSGMGELQECLLECGLDDLETRGVFFSWSNGRPEDPILRKLDRAL
uniref:Endonuclease/exonuclease/phosphatase domain-containing protein n=1 Tax=Brassica oleracea var. oleracea TaxID=109376 RepID=A0A0D3AGK3_BRAOL